MGTVTAATSSAFRRSDVWGWIAVLGIGGLAAAAAVASWTSATTAYVLIAAAFVAVAAASWRWPGPMLALAAFSALADPYIVRVVISPSMVSSIRFFSETMLLVVGLPIAVRAVIDRRFIPAFRHPATAFLAAFVVISLASALVNRVPPIVAATGIAVTLDAIAIFYLARMVPFSEPLVQRIVWVYVAIMTLAALLAIAQALLAPDILGFQAFPGDFGEGGRSTAFFGNPNQLGPLLGVAIPFPLLRLLETRGRLARLGLLALCLVLGIGFWLTFSRGTWFGFAVGFGAVALLLDRRALLLGVTIGAISLGATMTMPRYLLAGSHPNFATSPDVLEGMVDRIGTLGNGQDLRLLFIREGLPIAARNPFLGVGPGRYGGAAANVFGTPVYTRYGISMHGFHTVHDYWLHLLVEVGVLGLLAMVGLVAAAVVPLLAAARRAPPSTRWLLAALAIAPISLSANSVTEMLLEGNTPSYSLWLLVGMGSVLAARVLASGEARPVAGEDHPAEAIGPGA